MDDLFGRHAEDMPGIRSADFSDIRATWRAHVRDVLHGIWESLTDETTRLAVYLTAIGAFLNISGE